MRFCDWPVDRAYFVHNWTHDINVDGTHAPLFIPSGVPFDRFSFYFHFRPTCLCAFQAVDIHLNYTNSVPFFFIRFNQPTLQIEHTSPPYPPWISLFFVNKIIQFQRSYRCRAIRVWNCAFELISHSNGFTPVPVSSPPLPPPLCWRDVEVAFWFEISIYMWWGLSRGLRLPIFMDNDTYKITTYHLQLQQNSLYGNIYA